MKHLILLAATITAGMWLASPALADSFFFSTGNPDGLLGALSQPARAEHFETETADDFLLTETTTIAQATIIGLIRRERPGESQQCRGRGLSRLPCGLGSYPHAAGALAGQLAFRRRDRRRHPRWSLGTLAFTTALGSELLG
jgi:hypothetical protein